MNDALTSHPATGDDGATEIAARFGRSFVWGVATSAYQIEGAAAEDGRGDSIWDAFCRRPGAIRDGSSGDRACDHYHRYAGDVDLIADLGLAAYRFSVSWPRVQPLGSGRWNEAGIDFYRRLLDRLEQRGIAAHVTLNHWDLPQALQDLGGWNSRETVHRFVDYAEGMARRLGNRVASIATHNEPWVIATLGHEAGIFAPGIRDRATAFRAAHHLLVSHGLALQSLRAQGVGAPLGIVLNQSPIHPATDSDADRAKAKLDDGLTIRWYMDPLLLGRYPEDVVSHLGDDAPAVQPGDMETIRQPLDFIGVNYYTRNISGTGAPLEPDHPDRERTDMGWEVFPAGLTELLTRLNADYRLPPVFIMENGAAYRDVCEDGRVHDPERVRYIRSHVSALADALEAGVDVRGYFVWSLLDNFEWADGYSKRFGIVHVDYETQRRTPKDSALWYRGLVSAWRGRAERLAAAGGHR
ncbi:MAG: GH1 family beta-glucosidase [Steroidobacteraceae bacterium]